MTPLVPTFLERCAAADAETSVHDDLESLSTLVRELRAGAGGPVVAAAEARAVLAEGPGAPGDAAEAGRATAGVSVAWRGIAETGSVVLSPVSRLERLLAVLPPLHIVILPADRLRERLDDVIADIATRRTSDTLAGAYVTIVTGPSRTADIERVITIGAHGPRRLHVAVLNGSLDA